MKLSHELLSNHAVRVAIANAIQDAWESHENAAFTSRVPGNPYARRKALIATILDAEDAGIIPKTVSVEFNHH